MEEIIKNFLEWAEYNIEDPFALIDHPDDVIYEYMEDINN